MTCLPESTVQCFLDHELSFASVNRISTHLKTCSRCDRAVTRAKEEADLVQFALSFEMAELVPTAKLFARIKAATAAASTQVFVGPTRRC